MPKAEDIQNVIEQQADVQPESNNLEPEQVLKVPSTVGFERLQEDSCEDKDVLSLSPICPSCEKDENAPAIDWVESEEPYLDKRTCEYVAVLEKDLADLTKRPEGMEFKANEYYWDKDVTGEWRGYSTINEWASDQRRVRAGIRHLLRFYDKEENERIVCAFGGCKAVSLEDMRDNRAVIQAYRNRVEGGWADIDRFIKGSLPWLVAGAALLGGPAAWIALAGTGVVFGIRWIENWAGGFAAGEEAAEREAKLKQLDNMIKSLVGSDTLEQIEKLEKRYGEVNPFALEWSAFIPQQEKDKETGQWTGEKGYFVNNDSGIVKYQVRIPATAFDIIPSDEKDPDEEEKDETTEATIKLDNKDWRVNYTAMRTGLILYQYDYDIFRVKDGGSIVYAVEGGGNYNSISFKNMKDDLDNFKEALETLLNKNDYSFSYEKVNPAKWFNATVESVEIELSTPNPDKPLTIKSVAVTADGCPAKKISRGLPAFQRAAYNPTILYLLSEHKTALMAMKADEQMPLDQFAKEFIFPEIKINMGTSSKDSDEDKSLLGCIADGFPLTSAGDWGDLIQDLLVGTWDTFRDELTKRMCEDKSKAKDPGLERWFANAEAQAKFEKIYKEEKQKIIEREKARIKSIVEKNIEKQIEELEKSTDFKGLSDEQQKEERKGIEALQTQYEDELLQAEMENIMAEARETAGESPEYNRAKKEHPYFSDFKASLNAAFDFDESLIKLFGSYIRGERRIQDSFSDIASSFMHDIGWCGMLIGLKKLLNCLMGQLSLEDVIKIIFEKAMSLINLDQFFFLFKGLPIDEQIAVEDEVRKALAGFEGGISVSALEFQKREADNNQKLVDLASSFDAEKYFDLMSPFRKDKKTMKKPQEIIRDTEKAAKMAAKYDEQEKKLERDMQPKNGSIGDATANLLGVIIKAYMKALLNTLRLSSLLRMIRSIPGINLIPDALLNFFSCPGKSLVDPPLEKMLDFSKWKIDFCDPTKPLFNFEIPSFFLVNPWKFIKDAFIAALKRTLMRILLELALKFLIALEEALCKLLAGLGKGALNFATGNFDSNPFLEAFKEAFCGAETPDEEAKKAMEGAMVAAGVTSPQNAAQAAVDITAAMAMSVTTDEMVGMWIDIEKSPSVIRRISNAIKLGAPQYADLFGSPEKIANVFKKMSDLLPNDHKQALRDAREQEPLSIPVPMIESICPSDAEIEQWNNLRKANLEARGVSPDDAEQQIQDYMDRSRRALAEIAEAVAQGPDQVVSGEVQKLFKPMQTTRDNWGDLPEKDKDPSCDDYETNSQFGNGMFKEPKEATMLSNQVTDRLLDGISTKFNSDLAGFGGMLSRILSDTQGRHLGWHNVWANFFLTRGFYYDSKEQEEADEGTVSLFALLPANGYFPKTVGYYLYEQLVDEGGDVKFETKSKTSTLNTFSGEVEDSYDPGFLDKELNFKYSISAVEDSDYSIRYTVPTEAFQEDESSLGENVAGYSSQVLIDNTGYNERNNFDYKINISSDIEPFLKGSDHLLGFTPVLSLIQEVSVEPEVEDMFYDLNPDSNPDTKYRPLAFNHFFKKKTEMLSGDFISIKGSQLYDKMCSFLFGLVRDCTLDIVPRDGQPSEIEVPVVEEVTKEDDDGNEYTVYELGDGTESKTIPYQFLFGYEEETLTEENFEYVGPDGEEYTYSEQEKVLGKMKTPDDRVHILDPKVYGGEYRYPPLYIEEPKHRGWLEIAKVIDPEIAQCPDENIMRMSQVKKFVKNSKNRTKMDERLFEARGDCFLEIPFDRILGRDTIAMLEGVIKSFIRTIVIEQIVPTLPVISVVEFNERNYDDSFFQLITQRVADELKSTNVIFPRKIEMRNYYLTFLEQSVQMYQRMWERGDIEERPPGVVTALNEIREMQESYKFPKDMWKFPRKKEGVNYDGETFKSDRRIVAPGDYYDIEKKQMKTDDGFNPFDFSKRYAHYCALAYQTFGETIFYSSEMIKIKDLFGPSKEDWQFASKIFAIRSVEEQSRKVLAQIVRMEFLEIMQEFTKDWKPDIVDINRYILNTDLFYESPLKNFGTKEMEERVANGELPTYGDVANVISNVENTNNLPIPMPDLIDKVIFKLEKYIRVLDRDDESDLPEVIRNRDYKLRNVCNLDEFQSFINNMKEDEELKKYFISDLFGDAEALYSLPFNVLFDSGLSLSEFESHFTADEIIYTEEQQSAIDRGSLSYTEMVEEEDEFGNISMVEVEVTPSYGNINIPDGFLDKLTEDPDVSYGDLLGLKSGDLPVAKRGEVGLRYGIRIVARMPSNVLSSQSIKDADMQLTRKEKSYFYGGVVDNLHIPIASAEVEVIDSKIEKYGYELTGGENHYPYDLDCLLRKLIDTPEYKALFQYIFNVKAGVSLPAIISNLSFIDSIGKSDGWVNSTTYEQDGEEVSGGFGTDGDNALDWDKKNFKKTKKFLRMLFSSYYLSDDFEEDEVELGFQFLELLKIWKAGLFGTFKTWGKWLSWKAKRNLQDRPFNKDGEECKSAYDKLF